MSESHEHERELERRLELVEQARDELGDQVQHLLGLLEESRAEIRWLREQLGENSD